MAAVEALKNDSLWEYQFKLFNDCGHKSKKVLQIVNFDRWVELYQSRKPLMNSRDNNIRWEKRLWGLIRSLTGMVDDLNIKDMVFCHEGRTGHSIPIENYLKLQLNYYRWLPSTHGPDSSSVVMFAMRPID